MGKVFPIRQGVACQLKWTWNTLRLSEGTTACCHHVDPIAIDPDRFDDFHNYDQWIDHRRQQLAGEFPQSGCQYCGDIEAVGGVSDRMLHLMEEDVYPPELDHDPLALRVTPRIVEVFINNRCNMSCIYCDESNSSRIAKENQRHGHTVPGVPYDDANPSLNMIPVIDRTRDFPGMLDRFFQYLDRNWMTMRRLNVLGGEPLYQPELPRLLDFIERHRNPDLTVTVVSNLMVSHSVLDQFIQRMQAAVVDRRIRRLDIMASIDCWGPQQEYIRYGLDLDHWQHNFQTLVNHRWIYLNVHNTITSLSIPTLPDLLDFVNQHRHNRRIYHSFGLVQLRSQLQPGIFGSGFFGPHFQRILDRMPNTDAWQQRNIEYMHGIMRVIDAHVEDHQQQQYLVHYLNEIDRRRGLDWRSTFPWLDQHIKEKHNVV